MSLPLSKKQTTFGKNPSTNEHLHSKAREFKPCMEKRHVRPQLVKPARCTVYLLIFLIA
jgi:hypothetical protein